MINNYVIEVRFRLTREPITPVGTNQQLGCQQRTLFQIINISKKFENFVSFKLIHNLRKRLTAKSDIVHTIFKTEP